MSFISVIYFVRKLYVTPLSWCCFYRLPSSMYIYFTRVHSCKQLPTNVRCLLITPRYSVNANKYSVAFVTTFSCIQLIMQILTLGLVSKIFKKICYIINFVVEDDNYLVISEKCIIKDV